MMSYLKNFLVRLREKRARKGQKLQVSWMFLVPALLMYAIVVLYPSITGAYTAFTDWDGLSRDRSFVGLDNFRRLLNDGQAIASIKNTLLLAFTVTIVQNTIGLLLALGLNTNIKSRNLLRTIIFMPTVLTPLIIAFLWQYIYSTEGVLNRFLSIVHLGQLQQSWLGNPSIALWAIIAVIIWQYTGYSMIIYLAGLQGVPQELLEAAAIDGAGPLQRFWNVTRPMIAPAITVNFMLAIINGLKLFDHVYAMTGGGPGNATETLSTALYEQAFTLGNYGYGTTIALVLTVFVAAIAFLQLSVLRRYEVEV